MKITEIGTVGITDDGSTTFDPTEDMGNISAVEAAGMAMCMLNGFKKNVAEKHHEEFDSVFFKSLGLMMDNSKKYSYQIKNKT
ncbi:hypothetical protein N9955_00715 [bacterium]|nr:hypothetical protein [bacterium]